MHVSFMDSKSETWIQIESFFTSQMDVFGVLYVLRFCIHSLRTQSISGEDVLCVFF